MTRLLRPALLVLLATFSTSAGAVPWAVQPDAKIEFQFTQLGGRVFGQFPDFKIDADIDPEKIDDCALHVAINLVTIDTQNSERDRLLQGPEFFDTEQFPLATFEALICRHIYGPAYEAVGTLMLKGTARDIVLPIELKVDGETGSRHATAKVQIGLKRSEWGIGEGIWSNTAVVGDAIFINIQITATEIQ